MSLIGKDTAVISLGVSCQTALQLAKNRALVENLLGEELKYESCFFNWLISDCHDIGAFLSAFEGRALRRDDLESSEGNLPIRIRGYRLWLWHDPWSAACTEDTYRQLSEKYDHLLRKLYRVREKKTRIFVISNSQNNLTNVLDRESFNFLITQGVARSLEDKINAVFPGPNKFLYVCYRSRTSLPPSKFYSLPVDDSEWNGRAEDWAACLAETLPVLAHRKRPLARWFAAWAKHRSAQA